jgi:hypothetical protein
MTKLIRCLYKNYITTWLIDILYDKKAQNHGYVYLTAGKEITVSETRRFIIQNKLGPYSKNPILLTSSSTYFLHLSQGIPHSLIFSVLY